MWGKPLSLPLYGMEGGGALSMEKGPTYRLQAPANREPDFLSEIKIWTQGVV